MSEFCDRMRALALEHLPTLRFDPRERFFPIRAEAWLQHATAAPWDDRPDVAALPVDRQRHGTAIVVADPACADVRHRGGPPNDDDEPILLSTAAHPGAIGSPKYRTFPPDDSADDLCLVFGGWPDPARPAAGGDLEYVYDSFSELAAAMNERNAWRVTEHLPHQPRLWAEQPASPMVYCEVEWAGAHPIAARRHGQPDFPRDFGSPLDRFLMLTYYYLFPARTPTDGTRSPAACEGQWAAITLFFEGVTTDDIDDSGRPTGFEVTDPTPRYAAYSAESYADGRIPDSVCVPWSEVGHASFDERRPLAYVGQGSHRFYFGNNAADVPWQPVPAPVVETPPHEDSSGALPVAVGLAALGAAALGGGIGLLLWLLWLLLRGLFDDPPAIGPRQVGETTPPGPDVGNPAYGGPAGGDAAGGTNAGSARGFDVAYFDLDVVNRFRTEGEPDDCAPPPWWEFTGLWGIRVPWSAEGGWVSGMRRVDRFGRSWSYWHAYRLLERMVRDAPRP